MVLKHPPGHIQRTVAYFLAEGHYDALINRMRQAFRRRRQVMDEAIAEHGLTVAGQGGFGGSPSGWRMAARRGGYRAARPFPAGRGRADRTRPRLLRPLRAKRGISTASPIPRSRPLAFPKASPGSQGTGAARRTGRRLKTRVPFALQFTGRCEKVDAQRGRRAAGSTAHLPEGTSCSWPQNSIRPSTVRSTRILPHSMTMPSAALREPWTRRRPDRLAAGPSAGLPTGSKSVVAGARDRPILQSVHDGRNVRYFDVLDRRVC